jgi:hypothetical protein
MIDSLEPISPTTPVHPLRESYRIEGEVKEKTPQANEAPAPQDTVELSARQEKVTATSANPLPATSAVSSEEAQMVGEGWYRYGFESAYR